MSTRSRSLKVGLAASLLVAAGSYIAFDRWQREVIFSVELGESRWWRDPPAHTQVYDLPLPDGERVRAWYLPQSNPQASTVLYLHGSRWNLNGSVFRMERWAEMGYSVLAIDYRGFGQSTARLPSQRSVVDDAAAALEELARRQPDPARRFVYGHSLGGAVAALLVASPTRPVIAGLILESTFTSIRNMIHTTRWAAIPGLGMLVTQPFDTEAALKKVQVPVLILHGTSDKVVPLSMSDALYRAAQTGSSYLRRLVKIHGSSHSGVSRSGALYTNAVRDFMHDVAEHERQASNRTEHVDQGGADS